MVRECALALVLLAGCATRRRIRGARVGTCYADASFSKNGGGAWAVWLRSLEGRVVRRGPCPRYVKDSVSAELAALFAGVHLAVSRWGSRVRGVSLRSDCMGALDYADPAAPLARNKAVRRLQQKLRELTAAHGLEVERRWVKGHQPRDRSTAAYLNGACDRLARKTRRAKKTLRRPP